MTNVSEKILELADSRILIVDDEKHNVQLLERLLRKYGFHEVYTCEEPLQVEDRVREVNPDLLLLDLHMPGLSGQDLLQRLHAETHSSLPLPVLVLTGDTRTEARRAALNLGAKDFVTKPFDPPEVLCRINNLLESRRLQRTLLRHSQTLEHQVAERTQELRQTQLELVRRLGVAAEYRDDQTGLHIGRVSRYSAILAETIGMDEDYCKKIQEASQLHDIGKIAIPDSILLKPGKLDAEEWQVMKTHVSLGARILHASSCELLQLAEEIALTHHERWDGNGYLQGLKGEEIPLSGRIVSICDVFDALTSERPYKRAWSVEDARDEIVRNSGTQFDPQLVEGFLKALPRLVEVRRELGQVACEPRELEMAR